MKYDIQELFELEDSILFSSAREIARKKPPLLCSPIPIVGACTTRPGCRHCRWENIRNRDMSFSRKKTRQQVIQRTSVLAKAGVDRIFLPSGWMGYEIPVISTNWSRPSNKTRNWTYTAYSVH